MNNSACSTPTFNDSEGDDSSQKKVKLKNKTIKFHKVGLLNIKFQQNIMDDIDLEAEDMNKEIIKCFEKYIKEPIQKGEGYLPAKVVDEFINQIYHYWIL